MSCQVTISLRAAGELLAIARWWSENRSVDQAERWYDGFIDALEALAMQPERCPFARENGQCSVELRQLNYSIGGRATHRAVFSIQGMSVTVLSIRHVAQEDLSTGDLP